LYPLEYGFGGNGQTIAVIGDAAASQSDLSTFGAAAALPTVPLIHGYSIDGGNPSPTTDDQTEASLDTQTIAGLAPYAVLDDVVTPNLTNVEMISALGSTIQQLMPNVISISVSGCEGTSYESDVLYDNFTQEAAATGITIVASSGDQGPTCFDGAEQTPGVGEPASDPYVVAAGGIEDGHLQPPYPTNVTQLDAVLDIPQPWNDTATSGGGSGGGGVSNVWSIPSYQNAPGIVSTAHSSAYRNVPDIALPASNNNGPSAIVVHGSWILEGGTSWSAPQFAAMQAEINQQCGGSRWGLPDLYRVYYQAPSSFIDVTSGRISWPTTTVTYSAGAGYDNASGLGMPLGEAIAIQDGC
jgi:kumamolisin